MVAIFIPDHHYLPLPTTERHRRPRHASSGAVTTNLLVAADEDCSDGEEQQQHFVGFASQSADRRRSVFSSAFARNLKEHPG